eukprot:jgi/Astpho2/2744/Aster-00923
MMYLIGAVWGIFLPLWEARHVMIAVFRRKTVAEVMGAEHDDPDTLDANGTPMKTHQPHHNMDDSVKGLHETKGKADSNAKASVV